jgi:hypothetical protein
MNSHQQEDYMIQGLPSAETILSELPDDTKIWLVQPVDRDSIVIVPDAYVGEPVLWMFLKREDAEHFAFLLTKIAPAFANTELTVKDWLLHFVIERAIEDKQVAALITPEKSMQFFKEFEEFLPNYYK